MISHLIPAPLSATLNAIRYLRGKQSQLSLTDKKIMKSVAIAFLGGFALNLLSKMDHLGSHAQFLQGFLLGSLTFTQVNSAICAYLGTQLCQADSKTQMIKIAACIYLLTTRPAWYFFEKLLNQQTKFYPFNSSSWEEELNRSLRRQADVANLANLKNESLLNNPSLRYILQNEANKNK
ncbi:MAG: hypothetical protein QRY72_04605 [Candidatus Rhabdochlamydia sp.]